MPGGGEKKFYASANPSGELTLNGLTKSIEKISTVSGADIRAVLYATVDVMQDALAKGQIVRLGEPGSLRVGISSEGKATAEEVNSSVILSFRWFNFQIAQFTIFVLVFPCVPEIFIFSGQ